MWCDRRYEATTWILLIYLIVFEQIRSDRSLLANIFRRTLSVCVHYGLSYNVYVWQSSSLMSDSPFVFIVGWQMYNCEYTGE
jgi:hypothetical protein